MIYLIILFAIVTRFIPHMPNFAPITALAIFGAAYLPKKQAIVIPLAARFISDIFLGFFSWPLMVAVYASHLTGVLFGLWIRKTSAVIPSAADLSAEALAKVEGSLKSGLRDSSPVMLGARNDSSVMWLKIAASSLGASVIFFLVTNFAFLYASYPHNISGVLLSYTNALPFFRGTLLGDLGYSLALFGGYAFVRQMIKIKSPDLAAEIISQ